MIQTRRSTVLADARATRISNEVVVRTAGGEIVKTGATITATTAGTVAGGVVGAILGIAMAKGTTVPITALAAVSLGIMFGLVGRGIGSTL